MSISTAVRYAALAALFAALPAPASAQLGFIKKQLKQKIVHEVVDSALSKVTGPGNDSVQAAGVAASGPTTAEPQAPAASSGLGGFLKKRLGHKIMGAPADTPQAAANGQSGRQARSGRQAAYVTPSAGSAAASAGQGPKFDELVVEITPSSLGQLEKFLATQRAQRDDAEHAPGNPLAALSTSDQLSVVRFSLMTQRVVAYCAATEPGQDAATMGMFGGAGELQQNFTPAEIGVLRPRCPALLALLRKG